MHDLTTNQLAMSLAAQLHAEQFARHIHDNTLTAGRDEVRDTASSIRSWLNAPDPDPAITALTQRMDTMEARMTQAETALVQLDAATNEVAAELDELRDLIAGTDAALAERINAAADRLRSLAADPTNPVPEPEPTPEP